MKLFSASELLNKAKLAFERFPFALVWAILSAVITVVIIGRDSNAIFEEHLNLTLTMGLGISWLVATQFYIEQFKKKGLWWIKIIILLLLIGSYFLLPEYNQEASSSDVSETPYIRFTLFIVAGHLALFFAPFITVWHPKAYWNYLKDMIIAIIRSGVFSGILYVGLVLAMVAVRYLFDIRFADHRYGQLFIICLGIVNTWVYLSDFPKEIQHNIHLTFHKAIEVFVKFILIPLTLLYIVILYSYVLKIILQWELPQGGVSYLVIALAALLFIVQFIIHPVRLTHESRLIKKFTTFAFWLFLPLLILLYIAIYTRVSSYGITEARYFLILVSIFITGATLYFLFSRKKQLRYLPITLAVFTLLGSFGFWGAFSVSTNSQLKQFQKVYHSFAKNDSITLSSEDEYRFTSIAKYLYKHNAIPEVSSTVGFNPKTAFPNTNSWNIGNKILDSLGYTVTTDNSYNNREYYTYEISGDEVKIITGYDFIQKTYFSDYEEDNSNNEFSYYLIRNPDHILIKNKGKEFLKIGLQDFMESLPRDDNSYKTLPQEQLSIEVATDSVAFKIFFERMSIMVEDDDEHKLSNANASILIKKL